MDRVRVIPKLPITDARLTSSTVPELVAATYAAGTTYALGDRAGAAPVYGSPHTVYESLQAGNVGHALSDTAWWKNVGIVYPLYDSAQTCPLGGFVTSIATDSHKLYKSVIADNTGNPLTLVDPVSGAETPNSTKWYEWGMTNRHAMFDLYRNTTTSVPSPLTVVITPGTRIDSFGLIGLVNVETYSINIVAGGVNVYSRTGSLITREVFDWYSYFFAPFIDSHGTVHFDIPPYSNAVITVTLSTTQAGNVECGAFVIGSQIYLGKAQYNAISDALNFSTVTRDFDSRINTMVKRRTVPTLNIKTFLEKNYVKSVYDARAILDAEPAIWSGIDDDNDGYFDPLLILGYFKKMPIDISNFNYAIITIDLEEI